MTLDLAIILGSTVTSIYLSGQGVVLREPTIAALSDGSKKIVAAGAAALKMVGKTPNGITLINPVKNGVIAEPKIAAELLKEFLLRLYPKSYVFRPRINVLAGIPAGLKKEDCEVFYSVFAAAGVNGSIFLVPKIIMAGVGLDLPVSTAQSSMVAQLGGGVTDIAVLALSGVISSGAWGITIGGDMMDRAIADYIAGKYNLKISLAMARRAKEGVGSLFENDSLSMRVKGFDLSEKMPAEVTVYATDIGEVLAPYCLRIADVIETAVNGCGPEISCDILRRGIYLSGGVAKISGLKQLLEKRLELKINIPDNPSLVPIIGGGKLLQNKELLNDILS